MRVDKLEAREVDALVAEKILGWKPPVVYSESGAVYMGLPDLPGYIQRVDWYSRKISLAWKIVNKLVEDGETYFAIEYIGKSWWRAMFSRFVVGYSDSPLDGKDVEYTGEAESAPLAICYAALKVVMQKEIS